MMHKKTLLLNGSYEPLSVISWERALYLVVLNKAETLEEYTEVVRSPSTTMNIPSVIRLNKYVKMHKKNTAKYSKPNIFIRDNYTCMYCGHRYVRSKLTIDHVMPKSRSGKANWANIVTACYPCNTHKGNRTPDEANMPLIRPVTTPTKTDYATYFAMDMSAIPSKWKRYLSGIEKDQSVTIIDD